ncbi:Cloroperoxidase [Hymenopellis radicata]|nr:Cloroperoxidase [Hymenopellis radicata]
MSGLRRYIETPPRLLSDDAHAFRAPLASDVRSVCPALNTMANHGYMLPRSGRDITIPQLITGLRTCYGLSAALAFLLSVGGMLITGHFWSSDLYHIGRHNRIEHDASLVHLDTPLGERYGPIAIQKDLVEALKDDVRGEEGKVANDDDFARMRIRREKETGHVPLPSVRDAFARAEAASILEVFGEIRPGEEAERNVAVERLVSFLGEERLPDGWKPDHVNTLRDTLKRSGQLKKVMDAMRKDSEQVD